MVKLPGIQSQICLYAFAENYQLQGIKLLHNEAFPGKLLWLQQLTWV